MSKWFATAGCIALALLGTYSVQTLEAQGPIREGARRTGEAIVEGGEAVVEGTRRVVEGTAEGTRRVLRGTAEVATGGAYAGRETRYDAQGRPYYVETTEPMLDEQGRPIETADQRGQLQPAEGQLQPHESGYRGTEGQFEEGVGPTSQQVLHDRCGRPFICDNGRRVYLDQEHSAQQPQQYEARKPTLAEEEPMDESQRLNGRPSSDQPARAADEATNYAAPPVPEGASSPALNSNQGNPVPKP